MTSCLEEKFHRFNQAITMNAIAANAASEVPHEGAMCDLMWSDPEDLGQRGIAWNKIIDPKIVNALSSFQIIVRWL